MDIVGFGFDKTLQSWELTSQHSEGYVNSMENGETYEDGELRGDESGGTYEKLKLTTRPCTRGSICCRRHCGPRIRGHLREGGISDAMASFGEGRERKICPGIILEKIRWVNMLERFRQRKSDPPQDQKKTIHPKKVVLKLDGFD